MPSDPVTTDAARAATGVHNASQAIAAAEALVPVLREAADRADTERRMSDATMGALVDARMFRLVQPLRFGGDQLGARTFARVMIELARGDGSAGWVTSLTSAHTKWAGFYPIDGQEEMYAEHNDLRFPLVVAPQGTARPADRGLILDGVWDYASGCDVCNWLGVNAVLHDANGSPAGLVSCVIPRSDYDIVDNWFVQAMRGTGSKRAVIDKVFVPSRRSITMADNGEPAAPSVLTGPGEGFFRAPMMPLFAVELGAVAVGIGRGFIDHFLERAAAKVSPFPPFGRMADSDAVQARLGRGVVAVDAAEASVLAAATEYDRRSGVGDPSYDEVTVRRNLLGIQNAVLGVSSAVETLMTVSGTSVVRDGDPLMRAWRDLSAIRTHYLLDSDRTAVNLGRLLTGNEPASRN